MTILEQNISFVTEHIFNFFEKPSDIHINLFCYDIFYITCYLHQNRFIDNTFNEKIILKELKKILPKHAHKIHSIHIKFDETNSVDEKISISCFSEMSEPFNNVDTVYFKTIEEFVSKFNVFKKQISRLDYTDSIKIIGCIPSNLSDSENLNTINKLLVNSEIYYRITNGFPDVGMLYLVKNYPKLNVLTIPLIDFIDTITVV